MKTFDYRTHELKSVQKAGICVVCGKPSYFIIKETMLFSKGSNSNRVYFCSQKCLKAFGG